VREKFNFDETLDQYVALYRKLVKK